MIKVLLLLTLFLQVLSGDILAGKEAFDQKKYKKAHDIFMKDAKEGMIAKYNLGHMYEFGLGVDKDLKKAIDFYTLSANDGYDVAQNILGNAYLKGMGVEKNINTSILYYKLAAKQNNKQALQTLKLIKKKIDDNKNIKMGYLTIRSNLTNDRVYINDKYVGSTKITVPIKANISHKIRIEKDGWKTYHFMPKTLKPNEKKNIRAILKKVN